MKYNPKNERIKREYCEFKKEADCKDDKTIETMRSAILRFEQFTGLKDFATFNRNQATGFKNHIANTKSKTGDVLSIATQLTILNNVQTFLRWLATQKSFKSKIQKDDIAFFNLTDKQQRAAKSSKSMDFPTIEQIRHVLSNMPHENEVEKRDRAIIAFTILTAARVSAIATFKMKNFDPSRQLVIQDPKEMDTKFSKLIETFLVNVDDDVLQIFLEWVEYLRTKKLFGANDPLFPKSFNVHDENAFFVVGGLSRQHWANSAPIREIFKKAFQNAGLKYYNPHSFRHTLVHDAMQKGANVEELKALSQNLGHEHLLTTLTSYGTLSPHRQSELIRGMGKARGDQELLFRIKQLVEKAQ